MDRDELLQLLRAFEAAELEYVLIGATAMGLPRHHPGHGGHRHVRARDRRDAAALAERFGLKERD